MLKHKYRIVALEHMTMNRQAMLINCLLNQSLFYLEIKRLDNILIRKHLFLSLRNFSHSYLLTKAK